MLMQLNMSLRWIRCFAHIYRCNCGNDLLCWIGRGLHIRMFDMQGYGFLSENATFVDICKDHGIDFIGPTSDHINIMGDKSTARDTMKVQPAAPSPVGMVYLV